MILNFDKEIGELLGALDLSAELTEDIRRDSGLKIAVILFGVLDRGIGEERRRCIQIIQRMAMNPQPIVAEIRKPIR